MSARDRLVLLGIAALAVLGAVWILAVSPARRQASKLDGEVAAVNSQLASVQAEVVEARGAQQSYHTAYASLVSLGKAVPVTADVPALIYAIDQVSNHKKVQFTSISATGSSGSAAGGSAASAAASGQASAAQSASFQQLPFTFIFNGSYQDLNRLLAQLESFTLQGSAGALQVSGRLLTIQSITLGGSQGGSAGQTGKPNSEMSWTITATAYVLPPSTASAGASGSASAAQASGSATASSPTPGGSPAPAVVRVTP
jgi:Tfp pilus assembly protein PilO